MRSNIQLYVLVVYFYLATPLSLTEMQNDDNTNHITRVDRVKRQITTKSALKNSTDETYTEVTKYYNVTYVSAANGGASYWIDLNTSDPTVTKPPSLQDAKKVTLSLNIGSPFLFYGNWIENITVTTGGFLYMSDFVFSYSTITYNQYIAPLMAYFDTSLGANNSEVLLKIDDEMLIAEWRDVYVYRQEHLGKFSFQVQLHKTDGKIVAAYKEVPVPVANITWYSNNPLKIGISDAYTWFEGLKRTINTYDTYEANGKRVTSNSAIIYTHRETCSMIDNCGDCLLGTTSNFTCNWCSAVNRCSDGFDRQRQEWLTSGCPYNVAQTDCQLMFPLPEDPTKIESYQGFQNSSTASTKTSVYRSTTPNATVISDKSVTESRTNISIANHPTPGRATLVSVGVSGGVAVVICIVLVVVIVHIRKRLRISSKKAAAGAEAATAKQQADSEHEYSSADEESTYDSIDASQMNAEFDIKKSPGKEDITPRSPLLNEDCGGGYYYADLPRKDSVGDDPRYIQNLTSYLSPGCETPAQSAGSTGAAATQQAADNYVLDASSKDYYNTDAINRIEADDYIDVLA